MDNSIELILDRVYSIMDFYCFEYNPLENLPRVIISDALPEHIVGYTEPTPTGDVILLGPDVENVEAILAHELTHLIQTVSENCELEAYVVDIHYASVYLKPDKSFLKLVDSIKNASIRKSYKLRGKIIKKVKGYLETLYVPSEEDHGTISRSA